MDKIWHQLSGTGRKEQLTADQVKARNVTRPDGKKWVPCEPPAENEILLTQRTASRIEIVESKPAPSAPAAKVENSNAGITAAPVAAKDTDMAKKNKAKAGNAKAKPVAKKAVKATKPKAAKATGDKRPRSKWEGLSRAAMLRYNGAQGVSAWKGTQICIKLGLLPANSQTWYNAWNAGKAGEDVPELTKDARIKWKKIADSIEDKPQRRGRKAAGKPKATKAKPVAKAKGKAPKKASKPKAKPAATEPMDPDAAIMEAQKAADALVATAAE